jgi:hypothetical protein
MTAPRTARRAERHGGLAARGLRRRRAHEGGWPCHCVLPFPSLTGILMGMLHIYKREWGEKARQQRGPRHRGVRKHGSSVAPTIAGELPLAEALARRRPRTVLHGCFGNAHRV